MTESAYEPTGDVAVLTLSNPPANLFTIEVGEDIRSGVERARGEGARAMVIQADGAVFSGGADVSLFKDRSLEEARDLMNGFMPILAALEDAPFPVIAAVHGLCFAAGLELALACDLIIAAEGTQLAQVEALIGATTFGGGVYRLSERCGPARAREITFGADSYSAETFERWNIINRVVPGDQLRDRALEWAQSLAKGPTAAHAATKKLLRHALANGTRSADGYMNDVVPPLFVGHDMPNAVDYLLTHGVQKFRENHDEIVFTGE
jgi:enoyl-CoA hydratase/carnithine racemase